jgi:Sec-independent protein translocase protein TatA
MSFLNVGPWELAVVLIIGILLVGPRRMVGLVRTVNRMLSHLRRVSAEFAASLQTELQTVEHETRGVFRDVTAIGDPVTSVSSAAESSSELADSIEAVDAHSREGWRESSAGPQPAEGPSDSAATRPAHTLGQVLRDGIGLSRAQQDIEIIQRETTRALDGVVSGASTLAAPESGSEENDHLDHGDMNEHPSDRPEPADSAGRPLHLDDSPDMQEDGTE